MKTIKEILNFEFFSLNDYSFKLNMLLLIIVIFVITKLLLWIIKKSFNRRIKTRKEDRGNYLAVFQLIKYLIWVISIALMLEMLGVKVTVLIAGSAALLVGVGMGLQQTFNDFISGIILLTEGTTKVGDVLEIEDDVVIVKHIGLRTSKVENRDDIIIIVPNSIITTNRVINWSHQSKNTRFKINVGVAYGSDVDLVVKVLEESASLHKSVLKNKNIEARFINFGESSLDFQLLFFSKDVFRIETILSDIRKTINQKFIENKIKIPFPQMDVHMNK